MPSLRRTSMWSITRATPVMRSVPSGGGAARTAAHSSVNSGRTFSVIWWKYVDKEELVGFDPEAFLVDTALAKHHRLRSIEQALAHERPFFERRERLRQLFGHRCAILPGHG